MNFKKIKLFLIIFAALCLVVVIAAFLIYNNLVNTPYAGYSEENKIILIPKGTPVDGIINILVREGILEDSKGIKILLKLRGGENKFRAGEYLFERPMTALEVYKKLISGDVYYHKITISEGKDLFDITDIFVESGLVKREEMKKALGNVSLVKSIAPDAESLEGYLFPDTYLVSRTMTAEDMVEMMVRNFRNKYTEFIEPRIETSKFSTHEVITIASLIEKETALAAERKLISSVIHNRLRIGMGLQIDPTIIYALKADNTYDGNLKRKHKQLDSPYNTYKYRGLPPGPIANPGLDSIKAALEPVESKYLYYVSKNDGSHVFSETAAEHNRAVYIWQKKYWRDKWRKERAERLKKKNDGGK